MNDRDKLIDLRAQIDAHLAGTTTTPPGGGTVDPPPGGGSGPVQPPYAGQIHWDLGLPGEVSPTDTRRNVAAGVQYAIRFTKTGDDNKLRVQGTSWFAYVNSEIPGVRGNYTGMQMAGYHDIPIAGAPNGPLVVLFTLSASVAGGELAPQVLAS